MSNSAADDQPYFDAVYAVARAAFELAKSVTPKAINRVPVREAIWFWWTERLNRDDEQAGSPKYSRRYLWSPAAIEVDRHSPGSGELVVEHVLPVAELIDRLFEVIDDREAFREVLDDQTFAVITKSENDILGKKYRSRLPKSGDPWERYKLAEFDVSTFRTRLGDDA